jgi:hypothetical protein
MSPKRGATSEGRAEAVIATARMVKRLLNCILMVVGVVLRKKTDDVVC